MEKENIKKYDVLRLRKNPQLSFCGFVCNIGSNITLKDIQFRMKTFDAAYLEPATEAERNKFKDMIATERKNEERSPAIYSNEVASVYAETLLKEAIRKLFAQGDVMKSGGKNAEFIILDILSDGVKIKSSDISKKRPGLLTYDKLEIIINDLKRIEKEIKKDAIYRVVQSSLAKHGLTEYYTEGYLLGFAREYQDRSAKATNKKPK